MQFLIFRGFSQDCDAIARIGRGVGRMRGESGIGKVVGPPGWEGDSEMERWMKEGDAIAT